MLAKCLECGAIYQRKVDGEKCCENCMCLIACPNCGCKNFEKINPRESSEVVVTGRQILHD